MTINELHILDKSKRGISAYQGFYFQHLNTLKKWLDNYINKRENKIYCETNKDLTEILNNNLKFINFEEIKFYAIENTFTLNKLILKETIFDFFLLFLKTKNINTKFIFYTNSKIGKTAKLLQKWANNKKLSKETKNELIKKVYTILSEIKVPKTFHIYFDDKELTKENISRFIERVKWNFENTDKETAINQLISEIKKQIEEIKHSEINSNLYLGRLHWEVSKKSQNENIENRLLDNSLLNSILKEEYNTKFENKIDNDFLNEINKNIAEIKEIQNKGINANANLHNITHNSLYRIGSRIEEIEELAQNQQEPELEPKNYSNKIKYANKLKKEKKFDDAIIEFDSILSKDDISDNAYRSANNGRTRAINQKKKDKKKRTRKKIVNIFFLFILTILILGFFSFKKYKKNIKIANNAMQEVTNISSKGFFWAYDSEIIFLADSAIYYYKNADRTIFGFINNKFNQIILNNNTTELEIAISLKNDECRRAIQIAINQQNNKNEIYQYLTDNLSEGLRLFKFVPTEKFGYLDKNDSIIILPKFDYIPTTDETIHFNNGQAKVRIDKDTFYIDINGNRIK